MATARAIRFVASRPSTSPRSLAAGRRRLLSSTSTEAGGAGDQSVHSGGPPSDDYPDRPPKFSGAEEATGGGHGKKNPSTAAAPPSEPTKDRVPPFAPSSQLGSQELADPAGGQSFTQKRRWSSSSGRTDSRGEATPGDAEAAGRKVREDREYYRTHKPSPIAEVEFADTRKPITQATDGGAGAESSSGVPGKMVEDTVDDSLARAEAMFREARRGETPSGRTRARSRRCWRGAAAKGAGALRLGEPDPRNS
ncbi:LOW QUALITY PROTEIN: uncharacterized protein LOC102707327 [Oryza brachyantha]|uniref:LOW QUALITY PROTEIN: uncharacterized protein LOC102707327 n=1 Tax=Oryza brachyantha TaxID=4533 RepID=UPI001ADB9046|nr:LOW QUALITY PROTEIN: uncharacterized protein LOC102707327 [Oryza brachyantha]